MSLRRPAPRDRGKSVSAAPPVAGELPVEKMRSNTLLSPGNPGSPLPLWEPSAAPKAQDAGPISARRFRGWFKKAPKSVLGGHEPHKDAAKSYEGENGFASPRTPRPNEEGGGGGAGVGTSTTTGGASNPLAIPGHGDGGGGGGGGHGVGATSALAHSTTIGQPAVTLTPTAASAMIKPALRASTDGVLDPRCIEELPEHLLEKISRSKLTKDEIYSDWFFMLGILQFVGKCRFRNPWKEERKALHGPTGRDFRGDVSAHFIHNVNPMRLFRNAELIGQGGFGAVYVMVSDETKTQVAVKKMPHSNSKEIRENSWEVGLTLNCQHENVVELYKCYVWEDELWMVMEYLEGGSIADAVATVGAFSEETTAYVAAGVLKALVFMHDRHIVHRDLKSANVMLRSDATVKIIDFGLGRDISKSEGCTMLGSPFWMPPEMVQYRGHGTPADIFSCGITLIEMRTEHPPYYYSSVRALYTTGTKGADLDQYPQFSPVFRSFLQAALHFSPDDRATAAELLDDPFISMAADLESMRRLTRTIFAKQQLEQTGTLRHR